MLGILSYRLEQFSRRGDAGVPPKEIRPFATVRCLGVRTSSSESHEKRGHGIRQRCARRARPEGPPRSSRYGGFQAVVFKAGKNLFADHFLDGGKECIECFVGLRIQTERRATTLVGGFRHAVAIAASGGGCAREDDVMPPPTSNGETGHESDARFISNLVDAHLTGKW